MKLSKKLITAIAMLTLSVVMLTTSSFAWFSMNENVKATGMSVTAKAEQRFLQIVEASVAFDNTLPQVEAILESSKTEMIPVTVAKAASGKTLTSVAENETTKVLAKTDVNWFFATSDSPASSGAAVNYTSADVAAEGQKYTLVNDFKIRLNPAAGLTSATQPLTCSVNVAESAVGDLAKAVSVLVVCGDNAMLFTQGDTLNSWTTVGKKLTTEAFSNPDAGYVEVKVYIFFDGEHSACTTNNAVNPKAYSVEVNFSVSNEVA